MECPYGFYFQSKGAIIYSLSGGLPAMNLFFHTSYNLDLLNLLDVVSQNNTLHELYPGIYKEFGQPLSAISRERLAKISHALDTSRMSPLIAFGLSVIPNFEKDDLLELLREPECFDAAIREFQPGLVRQRDQLTLLFRLVAPVLDEIQNLGFQDYWISELLPLVDDKAIKLERAYFQSGICEKLAGMGTSREGHCFICALNGLSAVNLINGRMMVDVQSNPLSIFTFIFNHLISDAAEKKTLGTMIYQAFGAQDAG